MLGPPRRLKEDAGCVYILHGCALGVPANMQNGSASCLHGRIHVHPLLQIMSVGSPTHTRECYMPRQVASEGCRLHRAPSSLCDMERWLNLNQHDSLTMRHGTTGWTPGQQLTLHGLNSGRQRVGRGRCLWTRRWHFSPPKPRQTDLELNRR